MIKAEQKNSNGAVAATVYDPIVYGIPFIYGVPSPAKLPSIPDGWRMIESTEDFLKARDPSGQVYFLTKGKAYPERFAKERRGGLAPGDMYVDTEHPIDLA